MRRKLTILFPIVVIGLLLSQCTTGRRDILTSNVNADLDMDAARIQILEGSYEIQVGNTQIEGTANWGRWLFLITSGDTSYGVEEMGVGIKNSLLIPGANLLGGNFKKLEKNTTRVAAIRAMEKVNADGILITNISTSHSGIYGLASLDDVTVVGKPIFIIGKNAPPDSRDAKMDTKILDQEIAILKKAINKLTSDRCCNIE